MAQIDDFFMYENRVEGITDADYQRAQPYVEATQAFAQTTYQSIYIIDYYRKNFLFVSDNPLFLCGHTADEVRQMGYGFYLSHVPEGEVPMLTELNRSGFRAFYDEPVENRLCLPEPYHQERRRQREQQEGEPRAGDGRILQKAEGTAGKGRRHPPHIIRHHRVCIRHLQGKEIPEQAVRNHFPCPYAAALSKMLPLYPKIAEYSDTDTQDFKVRLANVKLKEVNLWGRENLSPNRVSLRSKTLKKVS